MIKQSYVNGFFKSIVRLKELFCGTISEYMYMYIIVFFDGFNKNDF